MAHPCLHMQAIFTAVGDSPRLASCTQAKVNFQKKKKPELLTHGDHNNSSGHFIGHNFCFLLTWFVHPRFQPATSERFRGTAQGGKEERRKRPPCCTMTAIKKPTWNPHHTINHSVCRAYVMTPTQSLHATSA